MKIGINARFLAHPYTGIGQYTYNLLQALGKIDKDNEYFLFTPKLVDLQLPPNFHQTRLPEKEYKSASLRKAHWEHVLVPQEMKKHGINIAHFLYPANPRKKLGIPTVVTVHDVIPWVLSEYKKKMRSRIYNTYAKSALKKADHIITVSNFSKNELQKLIKIEDKDMSVIHLAPPFTTTSNMPPNLHLRRDYLIYVGGYDDRKNIPALMLAYQKFIANYYPLDLILVGAQDRDLEEYLTDEFCERVANTIPIKPKGHIVFTPNLLPDELNCLYKQAKALIHVSKYEGFNLPLVEAMSHNLPIVCADIPVNHEVTDESAFFIDPSSVDSIGIGIHEFLNNKKLQKELAEKSEKRSKDFSWEKTAEETLYVYNLFS
ncbi:glycosyltransferase family 4 protein [Patescibacteria group bacterium]|nr:glycosyltransferase family 4 protein [Patescibacteria group bacterium]